MAAIEWTASKPNDGVDFIFVPIDSIFRALSGAVDAFSFSAGYWRMSPSYTNLMQNQFKALLAMIGKLHGRTGTIRVPAWNFGRSDDIGSLYVQTASTQALSMTIYGADPSIQIFTAGDMITVADQLFLITDDVVSSSGGEATLNLNNRIRTSIPADTAIEYQRPYCVMRCMNSEQVLSMSGEIGSIPLEFVEDV